MFNIGADGSTFSNMFVMDQLTIVKFSFNFLFCYFWAHFKCSGKNKTAVEEESRENMLTVSDWLSEVGLADFERDSLYWLLAPLSSFSRVPNGPHPSLPRENESL